MPAEGTVKHFFGLVNIFPSGEQASYLFRRKYSFVFGVAATINVVYSPFKGNSVISV
jgi:hypothetical protein